MRVKKWGTTILRILSGDRRRLGDRWAEYTRRTLREMMVQWRKVKPPTMPVKNAEEGEDTWIGQHAVDTFSSHEGVTVHLVVVEEHTSAGEGLIL